MLPKNIIMQMLTAIFITNLLFQTHAICTIAEFIPLGSTVVSPGTSVSFSIKVIPGIEQYNSAMLIIGTNASNIKFNFSEEWIHAFSDMNDSSVDTYFYDMDNQHGIITYSSQTIDDSPITTEMTLGTITLDTTGLLENSSCWVKVDYATDSYSSLYYNDISDPITGFAEITLIPEPTTFFIFIYSTIYLLHFRRNEH